MTPNSRHSDDDVKDADWGHEMSNSPQFGPVKSFRLAVRRIRNRD
jgi:hypothetical protein